MSACNILYGKYPVESTPFENNSKSNTPSIIIAETIPTLIQYKSAVSAGEWEGGEGRAGEYEQNSKEILKFLKNSQSFYFLGISPSEIGLITEIVIG